MIIIVLLFCTGCPADSAVPAYNTLLIERKGEPFDFYGYPGDTPPEDAKYPAVLIKAEKDGKPFQDFRMYLMPAISTDRPFFGQIMMMGKERDRYMRKVRNVFFTMKLYKDADSSPVTLSDENLYICHDTDFPKFKAIKFDFGEETVTLDGVTYR